MCPLICCSEDPGNETIWYQLMNRKMEHTSCSKIEILWSRGTRLWSLQMLLFQKIGTSTHRLGSERTDHIHFMSIVTRQAQEEAHQRSKGHQSHGVYCETFLIWKNGKRPNWN